MTEVTEWLKGQEFHILALRLVLSYGYYIYILSDKDDISLGCSWIKFILEQWQASII